MKFRKLILTTIFALGAMGSFAQEVWTIGPMLHYNFGGGKRSASFAIEAAYWNIYNFPYGVDFAIEFDKRKLRLYSETSNWYWRCRHRSRTSN